MKIIVTFLLPLFAALFVYTIVLGYKSARDIKIIPKHRKWSNITLGVLAGFIVFIEVIVHTMELAPRGMLFYTHIPFATGLLIAFLMMRFKFDGTRFPTAHRRLAYASYVCGLVTVPTGTILMWQ